MSESIISENSFPPLNWKKLFFAASAQIGIGTSIVVLSSFVNASMSFLGWSPSTITFVLGTTSIFELIRLIVARLSDKNNKTMPYFPIGAILAAVGFFSLIFFIPDVNSLWIVIPAALFYMGSAMMSTLIDSHLTSTTIQENRNSIATVLQITRLSGFAIGGIGGTILYSTIGLPINQLIYIVTVLLIVTSLTSIFNISDQDRIINTSSTSYHKVSIIEDLTDSTSILMMIFLFVYPMGLFMQDLILEPFAIRVHHFQQENIGSLVAIWTSLTFLFVPIGAFLGNKFSRLLPIIFGEIIGAFGIFLIGFSQNDASITILYIGIILFGIGAGIFSVPALSYMIDVAANYPRNLAFLLSIFGMTVSLSRTIAPTLAGIILLLTNDNFQIVFYIEAVLFLAALLPLLAIHKRMKIPRKINLNEIDILE